MKIKRISAIIAAVCLMLPLTLTGCKSKLSKEDYIFTKEVDGVTYTLDLSRFADDDFSNYDKYKAYADKFEEFLGLTNDVGTAYPDKEYGFQTELPAEGEKVAILHTNKGDIKLRLFPEGAPKAVENFITHIEQGYYNGLTFHRVINDFMIQGGDPEGTGRGGESIWGKAFEDEFDKKLLNIRGSLSMANSGANTNGSQFFINQAKAESFAGKDSMDIGKLYASSIYSYEYYVEYYKSFGQDFSSVCSDVFSFISLNGGLSPLSYLVPDEVWSVYEKNGGNISLDGAWRAGRGHTVFGQVYEGMDVVDAIAAVEVDSDNKPKEDVVITKAEVITYTAGK